jgi:diguanylate cyclase (GGDEF)-like protein
LYFGALIFVSYRSYKAMLEQERQQSEAELGVVRELATRDPLTGVGNKYAYNEKETLLNDAIQKGELGRLAVLVCDVNGLKHINDSLGHAAGDEYIRQASRMICGLFKHSPVYRVGGDEFVVLLQNEDYDHRDALLEELNRRSEENIHTGKAVVSAGMADYEAADERLEVTLHRADQQMYEKKKQLKALGAKARE